MFEVKRILHPTDFSDSSSSAMAAAVSLAEKYGADLHLIHIIPVRAMGEPYTSVYASMTADVIAGARSDASDKFESLPLPEGLQVEKVLAEGLPAEEIERYCTENDIDLVVMGTHGRSGLPHLILGSVAERVVRQAPCAVMTVRSKR